MPGIGRRPGPDRRAAAVERLGTSSSFAATSLLLEALDDPSPTVGASALRALVASGDRSLLPTLMEKFHALPTGADRDRFEAYLRRLEFSATMQMYGLAGVR